MTIELQGIELRAFHGVLDDERREGQRFLVDLELDLADETAAATDAIEDAVDYRDVVETLVEVSDARAYHLLEAFATAIADALLARFSLSRERIRQLEIQQHDLRRSLAQCIESRRTGFHGGDRESRFLEVLGVDTSQRRRVFDQQNLCVSDDFRSRKVGLLQSENT